MARKTTADEAPYGWSVIGEDGRRVDRWLSLTAAQELVARIAANTDEHVTLEPTEEPTALSQVQSPSGAKAPQVEGQTVAELKPVISEADAATLDRLEADENATDTPRTSVHDLIAKRRAKLDEQ